MKKILFTLFLINVSSTLLACWFCTTEQDQVEDMKEQLNRVKPIVIDPHIHKSQLLCRYKTRKEENISWYAYI